MDSPSRHQQQSVEWVDGPELELAPSESILSPTYKLGKRALQAISDTYPGRPFNSKRPFRVTHHPSSNINNLLSALPHGGDSPMQPPHNSGCAMTSPVKHSIGTEQEGPAVEHQHAWEPYNLKAAAGAQLPLGLCISAPPSLTAAADASGQDAPQVTPKSHPVTAVPVTTPLTAMLCCQEQLAAAEDAGDAPNTHEYAASAQHHHHMLSEGMLEGQELGLAGALHMLPESVGQALEEQTPERGPSWEQYQELAEELETTRADRDQARSERDKARTQSKQRWKSLQELEQETDRLKQQVASLTKGQQEVQTRLEVVTSERDALRITTEQLAQQVADEKASHGVLEEKVRGLEATVEGQQDEHDQLSRQLEQQYGEQARLRRRCGELELEGMQYRLKVEELAFRCSQLKHHLRSQHGMVGHLSDQLRLMEEEIRDGTGAGGAAAGHVGLPVNALSFGDAVMTGASPDNAPAAAPPAAVAW